MKTKLKAMISVAAIALLVAPPQVASAQELDNRILEIEGVRGVVKARHEALISSDLVARVADIPFREGQKFRKGDAIVVFDCSRYFAELEATDAEARAADKTYQANIELRSHRAIGSNELEVSQAKAEQAKANARALRVRTGQCRIDAPFNGRIVEKLINAHERPSANSPLLRLIGDEDVEIELLVASVWLRWLKPSAKLVFTIDELGEAYEAKVVQLGARVDPVSQTIRIKAKFNSKTPKVLPGMSGTARFEQTYG